MMKQLFEVFAGDEVTEAILDEAMTLFNENYGKWGSDPTGSQRLPKQGSRVKLSKERLRTQYMLDNADCSYARVKVDGVLAGHVFACRWNDRGKTVCWITQLVVHRAYRELGIATMLMNCVRRPDDRVYGIVSSQPAACLAAAKAFGSGIDSPSVALNYIRDNAPSILSQSPVAYIRDAKLRGKLFNSDDQSGAISSVNTGFFVDHTEPLEVLDWVRQKGSWPLGELLDGHEFLLIIEKRIRSRS